MKVDVLTVADVEFGRLQWWSNWIDVAVFDYNCRPFLLQMRINRINGKQFKAICITGPWYKQATACAISDLTQMTKET